MKQNYLWISELIWWTGSALFAMAIVWPYYPELIVKVPFLLPNIILTILFIQCLRLTFLFKQSPLPRFRWLIYVLIFAFIPISMYAIRHYSEMSRFFESSTWMHSFSYLLTLTEKSELASYIKTEFTLIAVVAFIAGFTLSGRMVSASWSMMYKK